MLESRNEIIIGIPTYKRNEKCIKLLKHLILVNGIFELAEIIVIDNCNNNNKNLTKSIKENNLSDKITHLVNKKNIGLDGSIIKLAEIAKEKGAILWFLCDDDEIYLTEVTNFLNYLSISKKKVNFCKFDYDGNIKNDVVNQNIDKKQYYLRASFLPTVAINPTHLDFDSIKHLIGTNYIHIAIINSLIQSCDDFIIYANPVGLQSKNQILTFNIPQTFIKGYLRCMRYQNFLSEKEIIQETYYRCKGYMGLLIKNIYNKKIIINPAEIILLINSIKKYLGITNFIKLSNRLFLILFLSLILKKS